jgi:hypothetical protein
MILKTLQSKDDICQTPRIRNHLLVERKDACSCSAPTGEDAAGSKPGQKCAISVIRMVVVGQIGQAFQNALHIGCCSEAVVAVPDHFGPDPDSICPF